MTTRALVHRLVRLERARRARTGWVVWDPDAEPDPAVRKAVTAELARRSARPDDIVIVASVDPLSLVILPADALRL